MTLTTTGKRYAGIPLSGVGSGTVDYIVKKNTTGVPRAGRIMVNGKRYEVMQEK